MYLNFYHFTKIIKWTKILFDDEQPGKIAALLYWYSRLGGSAAPISMTVQ